MANGQIVGRGTEAGRTFYSKDHLTSRKDHPTPAGRGGGGGGGGGGWGGAGGGGGVHLPQASSSTGLGDPANWRCSQCGNENWPNRSECNRCRVPRMQRVGPQHYGGQ